MHAKINLMNEDALDPVFRLGSRATVVPVVHGSGDFAWQIRRLMATGSFDCLAVPLPPSFQSEVEQAILKLPVPQIVLQEERSTQHHNPWDERSQNAYGDELDDASGEELEFLRPRVASYVPVDPCQPVIAALRFALEERIPRRFIDLETSCYELYSERMPDAYALKKVSLQQFASAVLPTLSEPDTPQWRDRIRAMAYNLRELCVDFRNILLVCPILDWPWVRAAFADRELVRPEDDAVSPVERYTVEPETLYFFLGELPFLTSLYERARAELQNDEHLSIDGVKELLLSARESYQTDFGRRARKITPHLLRTCVKYIRNLALIHHRLSPDLMTIITAAKQTAGDGYALHVLETAKHYPYGDDRETDGFRMGIEQGSYPDGDVLDIKSRLPGPPLNWTNISLQPKPDRRQRERWRQRWNPYSQCSWPPEDQLIENFRTAVFDKAQRAIGNELAKTEKFSTSIKDGIDMRDTLRHWYEGSIYVKEIPPNRGTLDAAVMLFDSPADPRDYPWRTTWFAEHKDESTMAFYATRYEHEPVGPGICLATYGGAMFLFPPVVIPDIWEDPRLDYLMTLEERLLAAACLHSQQRRIALLSPQPPGQAWKQLAASYNKSWIHIPLSQFGDSSIQQLRMVHVLNGKQVRSYAADFIRRA